MLSSFRKVVKYFFISWTLPYEVELGKGEILKLIKIFQKAFDRISSIFLFAIKHLCIVPIFHRMDVIFFINLAIPHNLIILRAYQVLELETRLRLKNLTKFFYFLNIKVFVSNFRHLIISHRFLKSLRSKFNLRIIKTKTKRHFDIFLISNFTISFRKNIIIYCESLGYKGSSFSKIFFSITKNCFKASFSS